MSSRYPTTLSDRSAGHPTASTSRRRVQLFGGGTAGNEQLTAMVGVILLALLSVIGVTILRMRQLVSVHLFVGLLLIGPVGLKMGSTGYRFARYYTRNRAYQLAGPPVVVLRLIAPMVVLSTVAVLASGTILLLVGPGSREPLLLIHKVSFFVWAGFTAIHLLGHFPGLTGHLRAARETRAVATGSAAPGSSGRAIVIAGALSVGLVLALVLIPEYAAWTAGHAFFDHR